MEEGLNLSPLHLSEVDLTMSKTKREDHADPYLGMPNQRFGVVPHEGRPSALPLDGG